MRLVLAITIVLGILCPVVKVSAQDKQPVDYVNPYIGTDKSDHLTVWESKGATFPGVLLPYGMVQIAPDGYNYTDKTISSFSMLDHSSGWTAKGSLHIMATTGRTDTTAAIASAFRHASEKTTPYYYRVLLDDYKVTVEYTATARTAYFRFMFPPSNSAQIIISGTTSTNITTNTITGKCNGNFFAASFSKPFQSARVNKHGAIEINYATVDSTVIELRIACSTSSLDGALSNQAAEAPDWNFTELVQKNRQLWNNKLKQIELKGGTANQRSIFYTALYHSFFMPYVLSDMGAARDIYMPLYPWDTYRSKHPLYNIIDPERQGDMISSELDRYDRTGWLPTGNMMGNHNIELITDAYAKGIRNFDASKALEAMRKNLLTPPYARREMAPFNILGYVPAEVASSVTHTLEFAYNEWALAEFMRITGKQDQLVAEYDTLLHRAGYFTHLFNASTGFMTAKYADGNWASGGYCEGTAWTYSWFAPHDVQGLINLMGGQKSFNQRLTQCFEEGHYVHDNEPPLHYAYLFNYSGEPWKTQQWTRKIVTENYANTPGGIPGNDDLGALSSWYVLSAMGFYPVTPGTNAYQIGSPLFEEIIIHLSNGKDFRIKANQASALNAYIQSATLNGKPFNQTWFSHEDILNGSELAFNMGSKPNKNWGKNNAAIPYSLTKGKPGFSITAIKTGKTTLKAGEPFLVSLNVANTSKVSGTIQIPVIIDGQPTASISAILAPGETKILQHKILLYKEGAHAIVLSGYKNLEAKILKTAPVFSFSDQAITSLPVIKLGDSITIIARVKNMGSHSATTKAILFLQGVQVQTKNLSVHPGEESMISFTQATNKAGITTVSIGHLEPIRIQVLDSNQLIASDYSRLESFNPLLIMNFDKESSGLIPDFSGKGNNGIEKGRLNWVDGIYGKAIQTNSDQGNYIVFPDSLNLHITGKSPILSMMAWVYPKEENNFADIISKGDWNSLQVKGSNHFLNFYTGGWEGHEATAEAPENWNRHWHHLAGVSDGIDFKLYLDGKLIVTKKGEPRNPNGETSLRDYSNSLWNIGRSETAPDRVFKGYIDDIMVFGKALNQQEINDLMLHDF